MTPTLPVTVTNRRNDEMVALTKAQNAIKEFGPFSRASHFALILVPVLAGIAYSYTQDAAATAPTLFLVTVLFVLGLGSALALLRAVQALEEWEEDNLGTGK
jgi:MFS-type transporter involved in bile tolerance (Atg22 family)